MTVTLLVGIAVESWTEKSPTGYRGLNRQRIDMGKIYVIISGEYSDWSIQGYAATEEEAIKACAYYNENKGEYADEWYYLEVSPIEKQKENTDIVYVHAIIFDNIDLATFILTKEYKILPDNCHEISYFSKTDKRLNQIKSIEEQPYDRLVVNVILDEKNIEKAKKIAQDRFAKHLAEQSVIG